MSLRLSEKFGVNPSLEQCFFCMEAKGVILFGRFKGEDKEAPRKVCMDYEPCDKCKEWMEKGVILISVNEQLTDDEKNPYRSGGWCVVKDDFIKRMVNPSELAETIIAKGCAFVPDEAWDKLGLPRGGTNDDNAGNSKQEDR